MKDKKLSLIEKVLNKFYPFIVGVGNYIADDESWSDYLDIYVSISKFKELYPDLLYSIYFEEGNELQYFSEILGFGSKEDQDEMDYIDDKVQSIVRKVYKSFDEPETYVTRHISFDKIILVP